MLTKLALDAAPRECCGLLLGASGRLLYAVPTANRAAGTTRYRVDPRVHLDLQRILRRFEPPLEIVGAFHSHPAGPARPSERDIAEAHFGDWLHVIIGLGPARPDVAAFRMGDGRLVQVSVRWQGRREGSGSAA